MTTNDFSYSLSGVVRNQGLPVAGVVVYLVDVFDELPDQSSRLVFASTPGKVARQTTGSKGEFTFSVRPGIYRLEFSPRSVTRFLAHVIKEIHVQANTSCVTNLQTGFMLSGRVLTTGGKPLTSGAMVALCIEPTSYVATSTLTADGEYSLVVPKGKFHLAYRPWSYDLPPENGERRDAQEADTDWPAPSLTTKGAIVSVDSDSTFDFVLPSLVAFNGEVFAGSQPVAGSRITFVPTNRPENEYSEELGLLAHCMSDASGKFNLKVEQGAYDIAIEPSGDSLFFGLRQSRGEIRENCFERFVLPKGFRLKGNAIYGDQNLSDCLVRIRAVEQNREFLAKTNADGHFEISLPGGDYRFVVSAHPKDSPNKTINGSDYAGLAPWSGLVSVRADTEASFKLQEGTALYGNVADEAGNPRAGVHVAVYVNSDFSAATESKTGALSVGITDGAGQYAFFLSPGTYYVVVHDDFANAKKVTVGSEPVKFDVLWQGWCQLRFEILGEDGLKITRCKLRASQYAATERLRQGGNKKPSEPTECTMFTGDDGVCYFTLPVGIYSFEFEPPQGGSYASKVLRQLSISSDLTRKIVLSLKSKQPAAESAVGQPS